MAHAMTTLGLDKQNIFIFIFLSGLRNVDLFKTGWKKSNVSYGILACSGLD